MMCATNGPSTGVESDAPGTLIATGMAGSHLHGPEKSRGTGRSVVAITGDGEQFGGVRDSGIGRENGIGAINEYLEDKTVWINTGAPTANPFVMR